MLDQPWSYYLVFSWHPAAHPYFRTWDWVPWQVCQAVLPHKRLVAERHLKPAIHLASQKLFLLSSPMKLPEHHIERKLNNHFLVMQFINQYWTNFYQNPVRWAWRGKHVLLFVTGYDHSCFLYVHTRIKWNTFLPGTGKARKRSINLSCDGRSLCHCDRSCGDRPWVRLFQQ